MNLFTLSNEFEPIEIITDSFSKNDEDIFTYKFHIIFDGHIKLYFSIQNIDKFKYVSGNSTDLTDLISLFDKYKYVVIDKKEYFEFSCYYETHNIWILKLDRMDYLDLIAKLYENINNKYEYAILMNKNQHKKCAKDYYFETELLILFGPITDKNCKNIIFFKERLESFIKQNYIIESTYGPYNTSYIKYKYLTENTQDILNSLSDHHYINAVQCLGEIQDKMTTRKLLFDYFSKESKIDLESIKDIFNGNEINYPSESEIIKYKTEFINRKYDHIFDDCQFYRFLRIVYGPKVEVKVEIAKT